MSLSSVPALLPPISFFLISIRMTILGRNVYPPLCHPAPRNHTTNHVHHHEKITFEFQKIKLLIQSIPKTNEIAACRLSPPALFPKSMSSSLLSCQNGHLEPATSPKIKRQTTMCITMRSWMQHGYRRSKSVRSASHLGCTYLILVPCLHVDATCPVYHTHYCQDWDSKLRLKNPL